MILGIQDHLSCDHHSIHLTPQADRFASPSGNEEIVRWVAVGSAQNHPGLER